jgi:WD40 repeat protein
LHRCDLHHPDLPIESWEGHKEPVSGLCFCASEHALFSCTARAVKRWSISTGWKETHSFRSPGRIHALALAGPDALLVGDDARLHALRSADLTTLRQASPFAAGCLARAAGTALAAVADGPSVWLLDPATGRKGLHLRRPGLDGSHDGLVEDLTFHPDGSLLVSAAQQTRQVCVWETASGRLLATFVLVDGPCRVAFDVAGRWLALLGDQEVHLHAVRLPQVQTLAALQVQPVHAAAWLDDGRELACIAGERWSRAGALTACSADQPAAVPRLRRDCRLPEARLPVRLAVDPSRRRLAWTEDGAVVCAALPGLTEARRRKVCEAHDLAFGPAGRLWLTDCKRLRSWQGKGLKPGVDWHNLGSEIVLGLGTLLSVAPGRNCVLVGGRDGALRRLCPDSGKELWARKLARVPVCALAVDDSETWALAGLWSGAVHLVHLPSGQIRALPAGHRDRVGAVAFLGPDRAVTGSSDGTVRLWQRQGDSFAEWLRLPLGAPVQELAPTRDGRRLALVLAGERAVRVWHLDRLEKHLGRRGLDQAYSR